MDLRGLSPSSKPELWHHPMRALAGTALAKLHEALGAPWKGRRVVVGLVHGGTLEIELGELVGTAILQHGVYEYPTAEFMARYVQPGDVCLDVGANIGFHTVLLARRAGPKGKVVAFEPMPELNVRLQGNVRRNRLVQVDVRTDAVSDQAGKTNLHVPTGTNNAGLASLEGVQGPSRDVVVSTVRLDDVASDLPVVLIKVDVEGAETRVFKGASGLFARADAPSIMFEAHHAPPLVQQLESAGYQVYAMGLRKGRPALAPWEQGPIIWRPWDTPNLLAVKSPRGREFVARFL